MTSNWIPVHCTRQTLPAVAIVWLWLGAIAVAQPPGNNDAPKAQITPATQAAVDRALVWLADRQQDDGSLGSGGYRGNVAVTALGGLAMMSGGSTPDRGPYGRQVSRCADYLLANTQESGFIIVHEGRSHGPMYGHGFATLMLAECYGMTERPELRAKLAKSVALIVGAQNDAGGWRYEPKRHDADLSVTVCQIMALRAARNAGIAVPGETIDRCVAYVLSCRNDDDGGFFYQLPEGESRFALTAAGVVALHSVGKPDDATIGRAIDRGLAFQMKKIPEPGVVRKVSHYYYGHYYAAIAAWQTGGTSWERWYPAVRDELLSRQREDGSWMDPICPEYATAMACIILQLPNNYLPIFQR
ncbi:MAG: terpene cyclase/mutase family protein [Planctomycetes bacterium]|nr:terpene cyclase/mutase family protein [Planctomycetota bacterium]